MSGAPAAALLRRFLAPADRGLDRARALLGDASRTVKFLRGRAAFEPRADDVFIASYPRSGTTWLQAIAYLVASGAGELDFEHISDVAPWWERSLAYRSDAPERFAALPSPRIFKTHLHRGWLPPRARAVYVVRDPADVAVSYYHLYRDYLGFDGTLEAFVARFIAGEVQYGRWADHVASWRGGGGPLVRLAYEDLRRDPRPAIRQIARLLDVDVDAERVEAVVRATRFERMRAEQRKFDHLGEVGRQLGVRGGRFVRRGAVGESRHLINERERRRLRAATRPRRARSSLWRLPTFLH